MTRRSLLTILALFLVGALFAAYAIAYLHNSPAPAHAGTGGTDQNGPVVDLKLTTVGAVGFGDHPNWVGYLPTGCGDTSCETTFFKVPPNATVRVTIDQQDSATGLRNEYLGLVRGTIGDTMTIKRDVDSSSKTVRAIDPSLAAHTFSVPDLGVNVPLLGTDSNNSKNTDNFITFEFKVPSSGIFHWQCFVPCGAGTLYGNGGPMQTLGYMDGQIEVQS